MLYDDLVLSWRGTELRVPPPPADAALRHRMRLLERTGARLPADSELDAIVDIVGRDRHREFAGILPPAALLHVGRTALLHWCGSAAAAEAHWDRAAARAEHAARVVDESAPGYLGPTDPGGGPIDPRTGIRQWFNPASMAPANNSDGLAITWTDLFACWQDIELDLHEMFGIDLDSGILAHRPWPWLEARIRDLTITPTSRLHRAITAPVREGTPRRAA